MKFTNISKFIIKFMGGGKINFPFNHLKEVEINGDNDGSDDGSDDEHTPQTYTPLQFLPYAYKIVGWVDISDNSAPYWVENIEDPNNPGNYIMEIKGNIIKPENLEEYIKTNYSDVASQIEFEAVYEYSEDVLNYYQTNYRSCELLHKMAFYCEDMNTPGRMILNDSLNNVYSTNGTIEKAYKDGTYYMIAQYTGD